MNKVIESGEGDGLKAYGAAIMALAADVQKGGGEAKQRDAAEQPGTLLADAARAKPAFDVVVKAVSEASGAALELAVLDQPDRRGRTQTGLKKTARIVEKAQLRPGEGRGKTERVCDVVRAMLVAKDMVTVAAIADAFIRLGAAGIVEVVRIKDRFSKPSAGGWRDLMINVVIVGDERQHVCEMQIVHEMMLTARDGG